MELTLSHKNILSHMLTGRPFGTNKKVYRDHYIADESHGSWQQLLELENNGFVTRSDILIGYMCLFKVTKLGAKAIHRRLPKS